MALYSLLLTVVPLLIAAAAIAAAAIAVGIVGLRFYPRIVHADRRPAAVDG